MDSRDSYTSFTALLASNLLAQFSRQIFIQILGLELPKVCGNLAVCHFSSNIPRSALVLWTTSIFLLLDTCFVFITASFKTCQLPEFQHF
jgi:hypothetical protein